jgi:nucleoid DNA-binding protein
MAYAKSVKKMDYLTKELFFQQVSARCNYMDPQLVKDVYMSLVKVIVQELRHKGVVRLPNFGDFVITMHKERLTTNVADGETVVVPKKRTVKFRTNVMLKKYLNPL